jgi:TIR domain-containing protein
MFTQPGHEVILAHAQKVESITKCNRKDDRHDARTLARLARIDPALLGPVRHRSRKAQIHLSAIRARAEPVSARTALVNAARGLAKSFGERLPKCGAHQVNEKLAEGVNAELRDVLSPLLREVESLSERIKEYDERMEKITKEVYPEVSLLKQVKGVGTQIAPRFKVCFNSNAEVAHRWFDNHSQKFSSGVEKLLHAHSLLEGFGMKLLPIPEASVRVQEEFTRHTTKPPKEPKSARFPVSFDVAISFAGPERQYAEELAKHLVDAGFSVFYDGFYPEDLWGKDLVQTFHEIYSKRSRYCVIFVSEEYNNRAWTIHERRSAQERMLKEKGQDYILPIKSNGIDLPGMPSTIGYVSIKELGIEKIAALLINKLKK